MLLEILLRHRCAYSATVESAFDDWTCGPFEKEKYNPVSFRCSLAVLYFCFTLFTYTQSHFGSLPAFPFFTPHSFSVLCCSFNYHSPKSIFKNTSIVVI